MTKDSLAAALLAVPPRRIVTCISGCHTENGGADGPALAAAARKWMWEQLPREARLVADMSRHEVSARSGYNNALADVAKALGLEP